MEHKTTMFERGEGEGCDPVASYENRPLKVALFQGGFDIFICGHLQAFKRIKEHCSHLIIALNSDELIEEYKKSAPIFSFEDRRDMLEACKYVDFVIKADDFSPMKILEARRPSVYVICEEWIKSKEKEIQFVMSYGGEVLILPYDNSFTPEIKRRMREYLADHKKILCEKCHKVI